MLIDNVKMAVESIRSNKMRTFLTMLGIIIGIFSVIAVISVGGGARRSMVSQFEEIGNTGLNVSVREDKAEATDYITLEDVKAIKERVSGVRCVSPVYGAWAIVQTIDNESMECIVYAGTPDLQPIQNIKVSHGRFYNEEEFEAGRRVAVIDQYMAEKMFGRIDVLGEKLDLNLWGNRTTLTIVGIEEGNEGEFVNFDRQGYMYIPITTFSETADDSLTFYNISIMATDKDVTEYVGTSIVSLLENRHNNAGRDIYQPANNLAQMETINGVISMIQMFITAVAAISLLVGGIGVMNIMLVSVTERTREIGIRKSLGAKIGAIQFQFLTESAILTFFGGLIGIVLGYGASYLIGSVIGIEPLFDLTTIGLAVAFSIGVGLVFGVYPARKAARLSPIEALRHN